MTGWRTRPIVGDEVSMEVSPYDLTRGRIVGRRETPRRDDVDGVQA
jgi:translation initiation factor IF-1